MTLSDDAKRIEELAAADPSFQGAAPHRLAEAAAALHAAAMGPMNSFRLAAMAYLALRQNGHTRAIANDVTLVVPLRFVWLGDGPTVTAGPYLGSRLMAVGGMPAGEVFRRLRPFLAGSDARARALSGMMLAWPPALAAIGAAPLFTLETPGGKARDLRFANAYLVPATSLYPARDPGAAGNLIQGGPPAGLFLRRLPQAAYVRLGDLSSRSPAENATDLKAILAAIAIDPAVIVDLRGNPGGDFFGAAAFARGLGALPGRRRVAVLIDKFTFSAALVTAALLKHHAGAVLVGEEMGDTAKFWAEGGQEVLPTSGLTIRWCDGWHDWETGIADPVLTPPEIAAEMVAVGSLLPDIPAPLTAADLAAGRDATLDAALRHLTSTD